MPALEGYQMASDDIAEMRSSMAITRSMAHAAAAAWKAEIHCDRF